MTTSPKCSNCGRCGGDSTGGATINTVGCTGACLLWTLELVETLFRRDWAHPWEDWNVPPEEMVAFTVICAGISELGCGYLQWARTSGCTMIKQVHERYAARVRLRHALDVAATRCPDEITTFYQTLGTVHERCLQLPTVCYTLHLQTDANEAGNVYLTSMSGVAVSTVMTLGRAPVNPCPLLPPPFYRIAADGNLYTFEEFHAYYGGQKTQNLWTLAAPCYAHEIRMVDAGGEVIQDSWGWAGWHGAGPR